MINRSKKAVAIAIAGICVCIPAMLTSCQSKPRMPKDPIVRVGNTVIGKETFEAFQHTARIYPAPPPYYFPAQRSPVTFMAEVEAIYQYTKSSELLEKVTASLDWQWKKKYYIAAPFFELMGSDNLGFSDSELEAFYKKNKEDFRVTAHDAEGQDSSFIPPFESVKRTVADNLFYEKYRPDSAFIASLGEQGHDSVSLRNHWLYNARTNTDNFYMRQFFFERNGVPYEDVQQIYGEGKPIASDDIDVIRSWVPEGRRNMRMHDLIEWLYKWKIFSEHAMQLKLVSDSKREETLHWALRIEYAQAYLREEVLPNATPEAQAFVTDLAELIVFDQMRNAERPDRRRLQAEVDNIGRARVITSVDSALYSIRNSVGITFLQEEFRDERGADFAALIAKADSLKEAAANSSENAESMLEEAEKLLRTVAVDFAFTAEGRRAMSDIAKMQLDKFSAGQDRLLSMAIASYRRGQALESDLEILCNSIFMTGFVYDEYFKNYALAEANYRWILRHAPKCALASDAEFMLLHLGEPMTTIEEIQGQSLRQGRVLDFEDEPAVSGMDEETD